MKKSDKIKLLEEENHYLRLEIDSLKSILRSMELSLSLHEQALKELSQARNVDLTIVQKDILK